MPLPLVAEWLGHGGHENTQPTKLLDLREICPNERTRVSSEEYESAKNAAIQAHDAFEEKLSQSMKIELDELFSKDSDVNALYSIQYFVDGFKMGAKLMLEILEVGKDD